MSSLGASLQGPDGILSLPKERGLRFAYHQQDIQTSAGTLTTLPLPMSLVFQAVKVIMAFVLVSFIPGAIFERTGCAGLLCLRMVIKSVTSQW